jgi:hypothetical protein
VKNENNPLTGHRGDALCGHPRQLVATDISNANRFPFVVIVEPQHSSTFVHALAHELGHNLFLGHGNGIDDDRDGKEAGRPGPKRYDEYCDPRGFIPPANTVLAEDEITPPVDCETNGSLMRVSGSCLRIRPLQIETARGVAPHMPGFVDATPQIVVAPN